MSLFDNPKTRDYIEFNGKLIILEMFKIFMMEKNTTLEEIQKIINDLKSNESGSSYTLAVPDSLNTYTSERNYYNKGNNVLFQHYDAGVEVYTKQENDNQLTTRLFEINKNNNFIQAGTASYNKGYVVIRGEYLELFANQYFRMYLDFSTKYLIDFSFTENEITFENSSNLNPATQNKEIIIPFHTDLRGLEERLADIEDAEISISYIHSHNTYVGQDPLHEVRLDKINFP
jgi:hypothetical protein